MARKVRRDRLSTWRDTLAIPNGLPDLSLDDLVRPLPRLPFMPEVRSPLVEVEDLRTWHPDRVAPLRSSRLWKHRLDVAKPSWAAALTQPGFDVPSFRIGFGPRRAVGFLALCVRRKVRREVLLALGRGGGGKRRPRRNKWSDVRC